ncbi:MAG: PAS domain-containing protein, partial [bacterium]
MTPRPQYRREWLLLALGTVLAGGFVGYQRFLAHDETRIAEETRLASQARTVADNMQRQLHAVNRVLKSLSAEFPVSVREPAGALSGRLQLFCDMTGARTLSLYDAQGTILASSRAELVGRNFRERGYFASLPARPDVDSLYVSKPFTTALGVYSINVSSVVLGPTGELAGLVSATLDPTYFEVVARSVLYANDMTASFVHGDGTLFFSLPNLPKAVGRNLNQPGAIFTQHMASGQISTVVSARLLVTGSQRMIANHNLRPAELRMDRPLVISVARDLSGIYQGWRWQTDLHALVFLAFAGAAGGLLLMSQRRRDAQAAETAMREREREEQAHRNSKELAERLRTTQIDLLGIREQLAFAADAARLGLWIRDGATGEVWVSEPGRSLFGFDAAEPVTYERMMQRVHPDDMDAAESAQTSLRDHGRFAGEHRVVLPDGSVRWVSSAGCLRRGEQGGPRSLFAISMDITERKLVEQDLQQQRREVAHLSRVVMLGELSGALAHELNQPLTAILSNAQAALRFMAQEPIELD